MVSPLMFLTFCRAIYNLCRKSGGKLLDKSLIEQRLQICKECPHFTGRGCKLCGCCTDPRRTLFNKLAYPTEQCPDTPPRFGTIEP